MNVSSSEKALVSFSSDWDVSTYAPMNTVTTLKVSKVLAVFNISGLLD
jgi:predicted amidohydrolase YtcJ